MDTWAGDAPNAFAASRWRLYEREDALLARLRQGEDTPALRAELAAVREAIRRNLRQEHQSSADVLSE